MSSTAPPDTQFTEAKFKGRLEEAAKEARRPANTHEKSSSPGLMEKVTEYVPAASKLFGTGKAENNQVQQEDLPPKDPTGPPHRPEHDDHIAEFVREQYRSKKLDDERALGPDGVQERSR
ncbi:hypothetical protein GGR55DRAFT_678427 [Xylaria sp. FL0064]|nr:hypothetical protein GGR55DRAFT_678427 [Xylaria sp. FL0064]